MFRRITPKEDSFPADFVRDDRGAVIPLFALMLVVVAGISGLAMDFARQERVRTRLSQAADAANLAAARSAAATKEANPSMSQEEIMAQAEDLGKKHFSANITELGDIAVKFLELEVRYEGGYWTARSQYQATGKTTLGMALGRSAILVTGKSEASIAPGFPVLDVAMCVDSTGSMQPTLDTVKANAVNFYDNLNTALAAKNIPSFPLVRVRMLYFKDFGDESGVADPDPLVASAFFELPDKAADFKAFVDPQLAWGGADWAESGLECLNEAMDSPWMKPGDKPSGFSERVTDVYPLVVVWTDASSHHIAYPNSLANAAYPLAAKMPRTDADLLDKWTDPGVLDQAHKQLLFFGDPAQASGAMDGSPSGWHEVMKWPAFTHGGTVMEANTAPIEFIANGIAKTVKGLRLTN